MPYIEEQARDKVDSIELARSANFISGPGTLNYCLTVVLNGYYESSPMNYQAINDILGALEGAKLEFYRRIAVPYETEKLTKNGDVYGDFY